jgi:hypothetical protein
VQLVDAAFRLGLKAASSKLFKKPHPWAGYAMRRNPLWQSLALNQPDVKQEWV